MIVALLINACFSVVWFYFIGILTVSEINAQISQFWLGKYLAILSAISHSSQTFFLSLWITHNGSYFLLKLSDAYVSSLKKKLLSYTIFIGDIGCLVFNATDSIWGIYHPTTESASVFTPVFKLFVNIYLSLLTFSFRDFLNSVNIKIIVAHVLAD